MPLRDEGDEQTHDPDNPGENHWRSPHEREDPQAEILLPRACTTCDLRGNRTLHRDVENDCHDQQSRTDHKRPSSQTPRHDLALDLEPIRSDNQVFGREARLQQAPVLRIIVFGH
jgi:hypothetical protein